MQRPLNRTNYRDTSKCSHINQSQTRISVPKIDFSPSPFPSRQKIILFPNDSRNATTFESNKLSRDFYRRNVRKRNSYQLRATIIVTIMMKLKYRWFHPHYYDNNVHVNSTRARQYFKFIVQLALTGFIGDFPTSPLVITGDNPFEACGNGGGGGGGGGMLFGGGDWVITGGGGGKSTGGIAETWFSTGGGGGGGKVSLPLLMLRPRVGVLAEGVLKIFSNVKLDDTYELLEGWRDFCIFFENRYGLNFGKC